jgi:hypothetical protein
VLSQTLSIQVLDQFEDHRLRYHNHHRPIPPSHNLVPNAYNRILSIRDHSSFSPFPVGIIAV